uniref:hypothetical protein n=1 Tax=Bifidobacterium adolescentis TaxID=1680 RepID=UPI003FEE5D8F
NVAQYSSPYFVLYRWNNYGEMIARRNPTDMAHKCGRKKGNANICRRISSGNHLVINTSQISLD